MSEQFEPHAEMSPELVLSEAETRRLVEQIEARIKATEKLERAIATRPQPSAEPVAWLYSLGAQRVLLHEQLHRDGVLRGETGWTETPLYPASALEAARLEALEQAVEKLDGIYREMCGQHGADSGEAGAAFYARKTIYELKENPNAG